MRAVVFIALTALAAGCAGGGHDRGGAFGSASEMVIAYTLHGEDLTDEILVTKDSGSDPQNIARGKIRAFDPGKKNGLIAFSGQPADAPEASTNSSGNPPHADAVYVAKPDASEPSKLIDSLSIDGLDEYPLRNDSPPGIPAITLAPDGTKVAFITSSNIDDYQGNCPCQLHVINTDGSGYHQLYNPGDERETLRKPVFSPDGSRIAFIYLPSDLASWGVYVINTDGSGLHKLIALKDIDSGDEVLDLLWWSPKGDKIAAFSDAKLYMINADGSGSTSLELPDYAGTLGPSISPDGTLITYPAAIGVRVANVDGSGNTHIASKDTVPTSNSAFTLDGKSVVVWARSLSSDGTALFKIDVKSGDVEKLASPPSEPPDPDSVWAANVVRVGAK